MPTQQVKFGVSQMRQQTPPIANMIAQISLYVIAIVQVALLAFPQIPDHIKEEIDGYAGGALLFINVICRMFGIQVTQPDTGQQAPPPSPTLPNKSK